MTLPATQDASRGHATVFVIDPDRESRMALTDLMLRLADVRVIGLDSAEAFLAHPTVEPPACVVSEVRLPGMNGLELQEQLRERGAPSLPMLLVGGQGDIRSAVRAVQLGAIDFIEKPFVGRILLRAVEGALRQSARLG